MPGMTVMTSPVSTRNVTGTYYTYGPGRPAYSKCDVDHRHRE